jgi:hypothetical protein
MTANDGIGPVRLPLWTGPLNDGHQIIISLIIRVRPYGTVNDRFMRLDMLPGIERKSAVDTSSSKSSDLQLQATITLKRSIQLKQRRYFHIQTSTADGFRHITVDPNKLGNGQQRWQSLDAAWSQPLNVLSQRLIPIRSTTHIQRDFPNTYDFRHDSIYSTTRLNRTVSLPPATLASPIRTAGTRSIPWNYHCRSSEPISP